MQPLFESQLLRFVLVGLLNTGFSYGIYVLLVYLGLNYAVANLCSLLLGIAFSFHTQGTLVFKRRGRNLFPRFLICWIVIYGINVALIKTMLVSGCNAYVAGALAIAPIALLSYVLQKYYVFTDSNESSPSTDLNRSNSEP